MRFLLALLFLLAAGVTAIPPATATITTSLTSLNTSATNFDKPTSSTLPAYHPIPTIAAADLPLYLNSTTLHRAGEPLTCIEKDYLPLVSEIHDAANYLIWKTKTSTLCKQTLKTSGYACDEKTWWNTLGIWVCGPTGKNVRCHTLAWAAKHIANNCRNAEGRAAGVYVFEKAGVWAHVE